MSRANWSEERKTKRQKWARRYYRDNKKKFAIYYENERSHILQNHHKYNLNLKAEVMCHYSGTNPPQCANPFGEHKEPYTNIYALSLDLIVGGHYRSDWPFGVHLYSKLKTLGYPQGWQVLCMNCQYIKRHRNNENPNLL